MNALPRTVPVNDFDLVQAIDRLCRRTVVAVAPTAHRRLNAGLGPALGVAGVERPAHGTLKDFRRELR